MHNSLRVIGSILWWAEGSKSRRDTRFKNTVSYPIELTNTNPEIIAIFARYVRECLGVDEQKIRAQIQVHENDNQRELEEYWSDVTGVPLSRFNKTIVRKVGNKPNKSRGTCKIRCYGKEFYATIQSDLQMALGLIAKNTGE